MGAVLRQRHTLLPPKIKPSFHLTLAYRQPTLFEWNSCLFVPDGESQTSSLDRSANIRAQIVCICVLSVWVRWVGDILSHQRWYLIFNCVNVLNTWERKGIRCCSSSVQTAVQWTVFIAHGVCWAVGETKQEYLVLKYIVELVFSIINLLTP